MTTDQTELTRDDEDAIVQEVGALAFEYLSQYLFGDRHDAWFLLMVLEALHDDSQVGPDLDDELVQGIARLRDLTDAQFRREVDAEERRAAGGEP